MSSLKFSVLFKLCWVICCVYYKFCLIFLVLSFFIFFTKVLTSCHFFKVLYSEGISFTRHLNHLPPNSFVAFWGLGSVTSLIGSLRLWAPCLLVCCRRLASDPYGSCHFWADISRRYNIATSLDPLTTNPEQSPSIHLPVTLNPIECICHEGEKKPLVCFRDTSQLICIAKLRGMWHLKTNILLHKLLFTNK